MQQFIVIVLVVALITLAAMLIRQIIWTYISRAVDRAIQKMLDDRVVIAGVRPLKSGPPKVHAAQFSQEAIRLFKEVEE